jgi:hypothetical protein
MSEQLVVTARKPKTSWFTHIFSTDLVQAH